MSSRNELACENKGKQAKKASFLLPRPYVGCQQKVWLGLKVDFPHLKRSGLKMELPTLNDLIKKNSSQTYPAT